MRPRPRLIDEPDVDARTRRAVHLAHPNEGRRLPGFAGEPARQAMVPHSQNGRSPGHVAGIVRLLLDDPTAAEFVHAVAGP